MNQGGVETWLMQGLRNLDPARVRMDFLVTQAEPGQHDDEIRALGSKLIKCESPRNPLLFASRFLPAVRNEGPYGVVHSHVHHYSGFVLALADRARIPVRIAHSHSDTLGLDSEAALPRRLYLALMAAALRRHATRGLAVSAPAAAALFGSRWRDDRRWSVVRCGIDFGPFRAPVDVAAVRAELGVPRDAFVLVNVGRFDAPKNQAFLPRIAAALLRRAPHTALVLVGDGPERAPVEAEAARLGIRRRVVFTGLRSDVSRILRASDVFVFPSLREGIPLVVVEAQAAGLPIVLSSSITREVVVLPDLFAWRSPADPPESWAEAILSSSPRRAEAEAAVTAMERSEFSLPRTIGELLEVYGSSPQ
jgi:glycosyltransferase involved in cell wall biosynthesis